MIILAEFSLKEVRVPSVRENNQFFLALSLSKLESLASFISDSQTGDYFKVLKKVKHSPIFYLNFECTCQLSDPVQVTSLVGSVQVLQKCVVGGRVGQHIAPIQLWIYNPLKLQKFCRYYMQFCSLITLQINFWQNSDLFDKKEHFSYSNIDQVRAI